MVFRILFCFFLLSQVATVQAEEVSLPFDHSDWDQFLKKFVNEEGDVNYAAAKKKPELLDAYLEKLKSFPALTFKSWPREEQIALLINSFNAGVIKEVLDNYRVKSIMNIPGGWDQGLIQIGNGSSPSHSLNQIENEFLRAKYRDEKILFALSRGAKGSARLRREAYTGPKLDGQLYLAAREFVNDPKKNRIEPAEKKIALSRIFQWYGWDFMLNWGNFPEEIKWKPQEMAVLSFLAHHLEDPKKIEFLREGKYKIKYETFDWRLNDWVSEETQGTQKS